MLFHERKFFGKLIGSDVVVDNISLFEFGQYGKGSLSRSKPVGSKQNNFRFYKKRKENTFHYYKKVINNLINLLNIIRKFANFHLVSCVKQIGQKEVLILSLQEAFFLIYGLGCLEITKENKILTIEDCWNEFCKIQGKEFFISRYLAYHYYRSSGWIVKSGLKYGCDFVLYSKEIERVHAEFCVLVICGDITWKDVQRQSRLSISVAKTLLICSVKYSEKIDWKNLKEYCCVNDISVKRIELQ
eukprot:gene10107-2527_t